jgi:hypothetical protein
MLHETRALRRASDAANARATTRRPMMILGTAAATLLGITLTAGIVSVPASGSEMPDATAAVAQLVAGAEPHAKVADDAAMPLVDAKDAVLAAQALTYDVAASGLDVSAAPPVDVSELQDDIDALEDRHGARGRAGSRDDDARHGDRGAAGRAHRRPGEEGRR